MNRRQLVESDGRGLGLADKLGWQDAETGCSVVVARPSAEPDLWEEFLEGAYLSYRKHGVECVLDVNAVRSGRDTSIFFAAVGVDGQVVGGTRISRSLRSPEDSVAVAEWAGHPGLSAVRTMIADRLPFGVAEGRTAWVDGDHRLRGSLFRMLVRTAPITLHLSNVRFVLSSGGAHVIEKWRSSGGMVATHIPPAPYPSERYQTKLIWWDRTTITNDIDPKQLSRMNSELAEIGRRAARLGWQGIDEGGPRHGVPVRIVLSGTNGNFGVASGVSM